MADKSAIEWTDATWNPIRARNKATGKVGWFCTHVSEGCRNCYAETWNMRLGTGLAYKPGHLDDADIFLDEKMLQLPLKWTKPRRIFTLSMSDLFADFVTDEWLDRIFAVMALAERHTFQVLTKRTDRMRSYFADVAAGPRIARHWLPAAGFGKIFHLPLPNVWLGTSAENQDTANTRIPDLLATHAAKLIVSCEPLLGPIDLTDLKPHRATQKGDIDALTGRCIWPSAKGFADSINATSDRTGKIAWVIAGGESGPNARPMHPDWARSLRDQCEAADVPFFFKQWGEWEPREQWSGHLGGGRFEQMIAIMPDGSSVAPDVVPQDVGGHRVARVGKRKAGRLLDGVEHSEMPF